MLFLRSLLFNLCFFGWSFGSSILFIPFFVCGTNSALLIAKPWADVSLFLARILCGITYEVRGKEHISDTPAIYASKHQSAWDTMIFLSLLNKPAYVLKRELLMLPGWGWYLWRMKMIAINREAKASTIKHLIKQAKDVINHSRSIIIFPEGTRTIPNAPAHYQAAGVVALYNQLKLPVIPVALNSGLYWKRDAFIKRPGTIIIEFLPAIPAGIPKNEFMPQLEKAIETASNQLTSHRTN